MIRKFDNNFITNVFRLSGGTFLSQLINLAFVYVAARYLFEAADFGNQALFLTYAAFLSIIAAFKLELGIVLQKSDEDAHKIFRAGFVLGLVFCLIILIIIIISFFTGLLSYLKLDPVWLLSIPVSVFFLATTQLCWMWYTYKNNFKILSVSRVVEVVCFVLVVLLFYFSGFKSYSLLFATLISQGILLLYLFLKMNYKGTYSWNESILTLIENKSIPLNNIFLSFYDIIQNNPINLFGPLFFNATQIGYYSFGIRFLQIPIWLLFKPLANVFLKDIAEHKFDKQILIDKCKSLLKLLTPLVIVFVIICICFGPALFKIIFGEKWEISGIIVGYFAIYYGIDFIRMSVSYISLVLNKQHWISFISFVLLLIIVSSFYLIASDSGYGFENKCLSIALVQAFSSAVIIVFIFKKILK